MDLRQGIIEAANELGISPADLATVISFETGGTFNPSQPGPRTRYGQHRGLIQFGEPQAKKYAVDWSNALESQLGANGAIVHYLRDAGVKPGTDLINLYSAVNAGTVGQTGAIDRGTTVAQKVAGMGAHKAKAVALFDGTYQPTVNDDPAATPAVAEAAPDLGPPLRVDVTDPASYSLLADDLSSSVGSLNSARRGTSLAAVADTEGVLPTPEFASATPLLPERTSSAVASAAPPAADALAALFKVKDIGQAAAINPATGAPLLTRSRRF